MRDLFLLLPLLHFFGLAVILPAGLAVDADCCRTKTVGGLRYNLVDEFDTTSYNCLSNCVYVRKDVPGQRFCFKSGSLAVSCMAGDMAEKMETVKGMKEKLEDIEKEAMARVKEQSMNALNMTNTEGLRIVVNELDGHMEEMKGFMAMDTYIKGGDLEAAMSRQEPKKSSPNRGTTAAKTGMSEEDLEEYVLKTKTEMSSMENTMANKNYIGSCCRWRTAEGRNFTFIGEEEGAVTSGCSSSCVYTLPEDMTRKFCDLGGDCLESDISTETPDFIPPQFEWVDSTTVLVTYQNTLDVLHLTPMENSPEEACLFDGTLEVETAASVTFQGCYNTSAGARWDILLVSTHLPPMRKDFIWWANGSVSEPVMLSSNCDSPEDCVDDVFTLPEEGQAVPRQAPKTTFRALAPDDPIPTYVEFKFQLMYDKSMVDQYGETEAAYITSLIANKACKLFRTRSITPRVICKFEAPTLIDKILNGEFAAVNSDNYIATKENGPVMFVTDNHNGHRGRVNAQGVDCPTKKYNIGVVEHFGSRGRNIDRTYKLFAHEMGHWLGMEHDFAKKHGGDGKDTTSTNYCNHEGIMSYGFDAGHKADWSRCSNSDWQEYYRSTLHGCMTPGNQFQKAEFLKGYPEGRSDYVTTIEPMAQRGEEAQKRVRDWGTWGEIEWCYRNSWVSAAYAMIAKKKFWWYDNTALTGLYLVCDPPQLQLPWSGLVKYHQTIRSSQAPGGVIKIGRDSCNNGNFVSLIRLRSEKPLGWGRDDTAVNGFDAGCDNDKKDKPSLMGGHNDGYWGDWLVWEFCPGDTVFCGVQTKVDYVDWSAWYIDNTGIVGVRFACCKK